MGWDWKKALGDTVKTVAKVYNPIAAYSTDAVMGGDEFAKDVRWAKGRLGIKGNGLESGPQYTDTTKTNDIYGQIAAHRQHLANQRDNPISSAPMTNIAKRLASTEQGNAAMAHHRLATDRGLKQAMALGQSQSDPLAARRALDTQAQIQGESDLKSSIIAAQDQRTQNQALAQAGGLYGQAQRFQHDQRRGANQDFMSSFTPEVAAYQARLKANSADKQNNTKLGGALSSGFGAILGALSDRNAKQNIKPAKSSDISRFLDALRTYKYDYKDRANGEGRRLGPMAQDLQKSEIGKQAVSKDDGLLRVDYTKLLPAMLAALVDHDDLLKKNNKKA